MTQQSLGDMMEKIGAAPKNPPASQSEEQQPMDQVGRELSLPPLPPKEAAKSNRQVAIAVLAWFDNMVFFSRAGGNVVGQVTEAHVIWDDGSRTLSQSPPESFEILLDDSHMILINRELDMSGDGYGSVFLNGVELTHTSLTTGLNRRAALTREEVLRVLRYQPESAVDAKVMALAYYPEESTLPTLKQEPAVAYAPIMSSDGRNIEDPRTYAFRDTFPTIVGAQVEWEELSEVGNARWFNGSTRSIQPGGPHIFAALVKVDDEGTTLVDDEGTTVEALKIQLYPEVVDRLMPLRINGVKVDFPYDIEAPDQGIEIEVFRNVVWRTAIVRDPEDIYEILSWTHEDEIDRLRRIRVSFMEAGNDERMATIKSLRDYQLYKESIR